MKRIRPFRLLVWVLLFVAARGDAQVPPHYPGTICFTPQFWCWLPAPVYPGSRCFCQTPYGPIWGVAG